MRGLFYRYNSICEPDFLATFREFGFVIDEVCLEMTRKDVGADEVVREVSRRLDSASFDFVFSVNFYPTLSEVCNIYHIRYISWVVDAPVLELFSYSIQNEWNRTFIFDRAVYEEIRGYHPDGVFYLPLGARVQEKEELFAKTSGEKKVSFSHDVAFVGSLYTEKNPYDEVRGLSAHTKGFFDGILWAQMGVYGNYFIEELLSDAMVEEFARCHPDFYNAGEKSFVTRRQILAQQYMGNKLSAMERIKLFGLLSKRFDMSIYTASDTACLPQIHNKGRAKTLTEMPLIFHEAKINLNPTARGIRSGLSLRIFDILSAGGFVLTNYQPELSELFVPGEELCVYTSFEEALYLTAYYLDHEDERRRIAQAGWEALRTRFTLEIQMEKMMLIAFDRKG